MEPMSIGIGALVWESAIKPIVSSFQKEYTEEIKKLIKSGLKKAFSKIPLQKKELELIETEVLNEDLTILEDKKQFLEFFEKNKYINDILIEANSRNKNIDITVEKGVGYIQKMNGNISF
ncbi:MAG: hypothetical protein U9O24_08180 [Campylobacterota bacterium]|nr:hypothetical protein [Campylobacterota bacterium]